MAHTPESVKNQLQADITASNAKTGASDTNVHDAVTRLIAGFGTGTGTVTPTGTKEITANGIYDVTNYASAEVNVPASGITPSGTKEITVNGEHDVTNFSKVLANIPTGLNAKIFTATVAADASSGTPKISGANDFIKSIRSNANAFVMVRYLGVKASTASMVFWLNANFPLGYSGSTKYNVVLMRQNATTASTAINVNGLTGVNYNNGHISIETDGSITCRPASGWPLKAGEYQIIAGTLEML